jgi:hypothetical protein
MWKASWMKASNLSREVVTIQHHIHGNSCSKAMPYFRRYLLSSISQRLFISLKGLSHEMYFKNENVAKNVQNLAQLRDAAGF